jgi:hypothetical protein
MPVKLLVVSFRREICCHYSLLNQCTQRYRAVLSRERPKPSKSAGTAPRLEIVENDIHLQSKSQTGSLDFTQSLQIALHTLGISPLTVQIIIFICHRQFLQLLLPLEIKLRHGIPFIFTDYWFTSRWTAVFGGQFGYYLGFFVDTAQSICDGLSAFKLFVACP